MKFDLDNFDSRSGAEEGFELQLSDPKTNEPTSVYITVLGVDSRAFQEELNAQQRRFAQRAKATRKATWTPEELENNALGLLGAATVGWRGVKSGGKDVPFSAEAAIELYRAYPAIREQVDQAIADRANFLPGGSRNSSSSPATSSN